MPASNLDAYKQKRDFEKTPEPAGDVAAGQGPLTFVVQKHDATRLHYDVRLEIDGVMVSFPVPKGPSPDTKVRRQAIQTEDHPLDYARFEGVIPRGEYGGGQVIVWDNGTYSPDEGGKLWFHDREEANRLMREQVAAGKISITFRGRKLKGSWTFVRTDEQQRQWLMIKHRDAAADPGHELTDDGVSVISGLTIADLQEGRLPQKDAEYPAISPASARGAAAKPMPGVFVPMLAAAEREPFSADGWLFEPKLDGIRALASVTADRAVSLHSRTKRSITDAYPRVVRALREQPVSTAIFDGEIVAFDDEGKPSFELLQQRMNLINEYDIRSAEAQIPAIYLAFDILYLDGYDLRKVPLWQRKELLARTLLPTDGSGLIEPIDAPGEDAYRAAVDVGFEGVVAKRRTSVYEAGKRSPAWLKVKARHTGEFIVGGYTPGEGARASTFGSILLGALTAEGTLRYCGRAGSGFTDPALKAALERLQQLRTKKSPFDGPVPESKGAVYVKPELIAEVEFTEFTSSGTLRAPVFKGFRDDKLPSDVFVVPDMRPEAGSNDGVARVLEQLDDAAGEMDLLVDGEVLRVSNLDKELWPAHGEQRPLTKRDLLRYLTRVSPYVLPHLRDRTITLTRYPNGINADYFYQKHNEDGVPPYVETRQVYTESGGKADRPFILCNNLPSLLWLGQLADLELHVSFGRVNNEPDATNLPMEFAGSKAVVEQSVLNYPDFILFDLDPYIYAGHEAKGEEPQLNRKAFEKACEVALWLKEILDAASLSSYIKTSGATGLHIYVPILRHFDYTVVRAVAETIAGEALARHPRDVTLEWSTEKRRGKIFIDVNQNARNKNLAAVFSPRAKPGGPVSIPVRWSELTGVYPTDYTILTAMDRIEATGDLWGDILQRKQDLGRTLGLDPHE